MITLDWNAATWLPAMIQKDSPGSLPERGNWEAVLKDLNLRPVEV